MGQSQPHKAPRKAMTRKGRCPICAAPLSYEYRPFCSRRCAEVDLSRWLRGSYAIPVLADEPEDIEPGAGG